MSRARSSVYFRAVWFSLVHKHKIERKRVDAFIKKEKEYLKYMMDYEFPANQTAKFIVERNFENGRRIVRGN